MATKARELGQLAKAITVNSSSVSFDRTIQVPGLLDSAAVQVISLDSAEANTIADQSSLLNALIFGG